ncbi:MAG TPA: PIG-L deacetylase family protein [Tepidisphaeraceae bacterium]|nr:PIG-L deacetylase family protein [Tepidisphaeraceae bacterium]
MNPLTRRQMLASSGMAALSAVPVLAATGAPETDAAPVARLKILVAGGHPGDPEAGCGGTIARYTALGHAVTVLYLTRGEAGVTGKSSAQAAEVRSAEARKACGILKATPLFASQIDGATEVTAARYAEFDKLIAGVNPDVVFTQWPVDNHRDHRACALLAYDAWVRSGQKFALYYYEVDLGSDTQCFKPTHYVDVTQTEAAKRAACMAHQSQNPNGFYLKDHVPMLRFRGMERGCKFAEGFIHHDQSPGGPLPGRIAEAVFSG